MTTLGSFRERARRRLGEGRQGTIDLLSGAISTTGNDVGLLLGETYVAKGTIIEIGSEQMLVTQVNSVNSVLVRRGWNGTVATTHAQHAEVRIQPAFFSRDIDELMAEELRSWPVQLGRIVEVELTGTPFGAQDSTLTGEIRAVLDARVRDINGDWSSVDVQILPDPGGGVFASNYGVQLPLNVGVADIVQLVVLTPFDLTSFADDVDLQATIGVPASCEDILMLGVAARSLPFRELLRTDASARVDSGETERHPATHSMQVAGGLQQLRDRRLNEEIARMSSRYPILMSTQA